MNNFLKKKLSSGALQFAIYTAGIVALLLFGLILYLHTFSFFGQQINNSNTTIKATDYGFSFILNENEIQKDTFAIPLYENTTTEIKGMNETWGLFQKTKIISKSKQKSFQKIALLGSNISPTKRKALYLKDLFKPLVVVGNTKIEGNAILPEAGIRPGNIAGNSYYGNQLLYGSMDKSAEKLPDLNPLIHENIAYLLKKGKPNSNEAYLDYTTQNKNSFFENTKWMYSNSILTVKEKFIGNIIIKSDTLITITASSYLKDVIVIAPHVIIEDDVSGNFQVIASSRIHIGKNVTLDYPSALVLKKDKIEGVKENNITIEENSTVKGLVCYFTKALVSNFTTEIICNENTTILGEVYCEGNFELKGSVIGTVFAHQFISNTAGTIFINHLYNASINSEKLPNFYSGLLIDNEPKSIMKWLY
ncbi:conserved hypothetical protein [Flavobacterium sp. 9AF]|uniref:hypothetical protein n=1 Tax=Flavobacterium sp. 9AF TaxID=2653142 RepID=UPI0012EFE5DB|nr:hypothetical protein [Flavobacterium sp. 9AF]VXB36636.1 conserved hypothetical protein [Flavobacterium sp. 9AF]